MTRTPGGLELALPVRALDVPRALALARRAEERGWRGLWASEVLGLDALVLLGAVARETRRTRLGTAIVPIGTRSAAVLAMAASALAQLAPQGFSLGVGLSTPAIVAARHDRAVPEPLEEARGTLEVIRAALRGERVSWPARPAVTDLRIAAPPVPPPVLLAALGPRMTELAYQHADGLVLNLLPFGESARRAAEGRARRGEAFESVLSVRVCVEPSADDVASIRRELASYCRVDVYARSLAGCGLEVGAVRAAADVDAAARLLPDALVGQLAVLGSARECQERLAELDRSGVTVLVVGAGQRDSSERLLEALDPGA